MHTPSRSREARPSAAQRNASPRFPLEVAGRRTLEVAGRRTLKVAGRRTLEVAGRRTLTLTLALALMACTGCSDDSAPLPPDSGPPPRDAHLEQGGGDGGGDAGDGGARAEAGVFDLGPIQVPQPVAYWSMDSADISGAQLAATVGAIPGALVETTTDSAGRVSEALFFNGDTAYLSFGDVLDEVLAGPDAAFSVSMWIKPENPFVNRLLLVKTADSSCTPPEDQRQVYTFIDPVGRPGLIFQPPAQGNAAQVSTIGPVMLEGAWHHVVFIYDGAADASHLARVSIYLDGVLLEERDSGAPPTFPFDLADTTAPLTFGVRLSSAGVPCGEGGVNPFNGSVDELAIYSGLLTEAEVQDLRKLGLAGRPLWP